MPNGTTAVSSVLLLSATPIIAQAMVEDKLYGLLLQIPAVLALVWLLVRQTNDRNRKDGEQTGLLREIMTISANSTEAIKDSAEAMRGISAVITEFKHDMNLLRESVAHQRSIIEKLRGETDHRAALNHTQKIEAIPS